jgi:hypothetical protein
MSNLLKKYASSKQATLISLLTIIKVIKVVVVIPIIVTSITTTKADYLSNISTTSPSG